MLLMSDIFLTKYKYIRAKTLCQRETVLLITLIYFLLPFQFFFLLKKMFHITIIRLVLPEFQQAQTTA